MLLSFNLYLSDSKNVESFFNNKVNNFISKINESKNIENLIREDLIEYIDYRQISYQIIYRDLKNIDNNTREEFVSAFKEHLIKTYAGFLTSKNIKNINLEIKRVSKLSKKVYKIDTLLKSGQNIKFYIRERENKFLLYDIESEGISLEKTKINEVKALLRKK